MNNNVISNYFSFFDKDGKPLDVLSVEVDEDGKFSKITYFDSGSEYTLSSGEYTYTNMILSVPGIGYAYCGDIVTLERYREKAKRFVLNFGWHENISNQKLYTWYLTQATLADGEEKECKTLYYEDLCNILAIEHLSAGMIPDEQESM
jgi:hypothetical protein